MRRETEGLGRRRGGTQCEAGETRPSGKRVLKGRPVGENEERRMAETEREMTSVEEDDRKAVSSFLIWTSGR